MNSLVHAEKATLSLKLTLTQLLRAEQVYKAIWQETTVVAVKMLLCKVCAPFGKTKAIAEARGARLTSAHEDRSLSAVSIHRHQAHVVTHGALYHFNQLGSDVSALVCSACPSRLSLIAWLWH